MFYKRLWLLITNVYQRNITKSTELNKAEPYNTCDKRTFLTILFTCRPKYLLLKMALVEIILPKINGRGG